MLLGRYELQSVVTRETRGATYEAVLCGEGGFQRSSTVVTLDSRDPMLLAQFLESTKAAAALSHPNIARVFDLGVESGRYYYARERVDGISLASLIARLDSQRRQLPREIALFIGLRVLEAIAHAHRKELGVIHRALTLENVVISDRGDVKVIGFGGEALLGSEHREAPELSSGHDHDKRTNVYDVARLLEALIAPGGRPPTLSSLISRARAPQRAARFPSAVELLIALRDVVNQVGLATTRARLAEWLGQELAPRRRIARGSVSSQLPSVSEPAAPPAVARPATPEPLEPVAAAIARPGCWKNALILLALSLLLFATSLTLTIALD